MPTPIPEVLRGLAAAFDELGVDWYLFGAQAAIVHGATRMTADVDVTIRTGERSNEEVIGALRRAGFEPVLDDAEFVATTRVLPLVHAASSMPVDVVLAGSGLEDGILARARPMAIGGVVAPVATAEDIVTLKVLAGRPKDLEDAAQVIAAAGATLDDTQIEGLLVELEQALDQSDLLPRWQRLRDESNA